MAKRVSPGHLKIKDESLGVHPKKAILKVKSKHSKTDPKRGGKKGALNDSDTPNKKPPQPEASWKEDINSKTGGKKGGKRDEDISRCMCIQQKEPSEWMQMRMNFIIANGLPLDYQLLREEEEEEEEEHRISNQEQIKVPGSPQCPSLETVELIDLEEDPEESARWLEWTSAAWRGVRNADIARSTRSWLEYETK